MPSWARMGLARAHCPRSAAAPARPPAAAAWPARPPLPSLSPLCTLQLLCCVMMGAALGVLRPLVPPRDRPLISPAVQVLVGHPEYEVTAGRATYKGQNLFELEPEQRSHMGLFLRCDQSHMQDGAGQQPAGRSVWAGGRVAEPGAGCCCSHTAAAAQLIATAATHPVPPPPHTCTCAPPPPPPAPACSFQSPVEIPGVSNIDFLRIATNARRRAGGESDLDPLEFYAHVMPKVGAGL